MAGVQQGEEFEEGDVWDVLQDNRGHQQAGLLVATTTTPPRIRRGSSNKFSKKIASSSSSSKYDESPAASGGVAGAGMARGKGRSSAPVAIPVGSSSRRRSSPARRGGGGSSDDDEEDEEEEGGMLPPHEWLARKMERMGVASSTADHHQLPCPPGRSKGRELTKVRDAVLPKTAFSEH